jgi:hypothetical protein
MDERLEELRRQLDQKTTEIESLATAIKAWAASKIWNRLSTKGWSRPWRKRGFGLVPPVLQPKKRMFSRMCLGHETWEATALPLSYTRPPRSHNTRPGAQKALAPSMASPFRELGRADRYEASPPIFRIVAA